MLLAAPAGATNRARLVYLRGAGAETCPAEGEVRDAVAALLGYDPFSAWAEDTLVAEIQHGPQAGFIATIKLVDPQNVTRGARRMETHGACADLVSNMALTISIAIDPMAAGAKTATDDGPPRERAVEATEPGAPGGREGGDVPATAAETPTSSAPAVPATRIVWGMGIGALGGIGTGPGPNVGATVFGEARFRDVSFGLEGRADGSSSSSVSGPLGTSSRVASSLLAGTARLCGHTRAVFGCALGTLGSLRASGADVAAPGDADSLYAAVGGRLGYELPLNGWLSARANLDGAVVLTRYALTISGREVFRYSPIAGNLGLSLVAHL